jgi:hypothetical protein
MSKTDGNRSGRTTRLAMAGAALALVVMTGCAGNILGFSDRSSLAVQLPDEDELNLGPMVDDDPNSIPPAAAVGYHPSATP